MTERSDIHKSSIFNLQSSIPALPGWDMVPRKPEVFEMKQKRY